MRIVDSFVVASGHENRSRALPGLQTLAENQFIVAYRDASVHPVGEHEKIDDGVIKVTRSFDGAKIGNLQVLYGRKMVGIVLVVEL